MRSKIDAILTAAPSLHVLVIGDVMLDQYVWGDATRISPEAPVPVVDITRDSSTAGGAANVALNLVSLGARASVLGHIANDNAGIELGRILDQAGVERIALRSPAPTITKCRVMVQRQQMCRLDREASPTQYSIPLPALRRSLAGVAGKVDAIILSDYAKGVISDELVDEVSRFGRKHEVLVALDPKPKRKLKFFGLDLMTPNKKEALELADMNFGAHAAFPAEEVCRTIHQKYGTKSLVITMGEAGMLLSREGRVAKQIPTAAREVFDVSGAGDTALAALVLGMSAGAEFETAAHFANAAAGVVVGKLGTATATATELREYVEQHR